MSVTNLDNDLPGVTLSKSSATVSENGTTDSWTVALAARPLSDVVLDVSSANAGEVTVTPPQLTFTPANWDTPQPVTVTGADDSPPTVDGNSTVNVTLAVNDALSDNAWDALADQSVSVTNQDNDTPGFTVSKTSVTVSEDGTSDTFTVVLTARPLSDVVLAINGGMSSEVLTSPPT